MIVHACMCKKGIHVTMGMMMNKLEVSVLFLPPAVSFLTFPHSFRFHVTMQPAIFGILQCML